MDSIFTHLMDLRDALMADDERGISLAIERLEPDIAQLTKARAEAGVRSRRITDSILREEDLRIQDARYWTHRLFPAGPFGFLRLRCGDCGDETQPKALAIMKQATVGWQSGRMHRS